MKLSLLPSVLAVALGLGVMAGVATFWAESANCGYQGCLAHTR